MKSEEQLGQCDVMCDAGWRVDGVMEWFPCTTQAAMEVWLLVSDTGDESLLLYLNLQHTHLPGQQ